MDKDDWYFLIGVALSLAAFFGVDWTFLRGKLATPGSQRARQIMMFVLIVGSLTMSGFGWYRADHRDVTAWESPKQETIYAKSFVNETVKLDGKIFDHCHFENVKLLYRGVGPVSFNQSDFKGQVQFGSDNIGIEQFMLTSTDLDKVTGLVRLRTWTEFDSNGNPIPTP